ncbi:hypothetical protein [Paenibacillus sp. NPDC058177]|uniref:hypothetical protein n=1 Tax=Paenibacillus sp. NPDC058177 TaxID=3346369 RepID=UPI0036DC85AC
MFYHFSHRHTACTVNGVVDKVILSRESRSASQVSKESNYNGVFAPTSPVETGALVVAVDSFLVTSLRRSTDQDKNCGMVKVNAKVEVRRYRQEYNKNDNPVGKPEFKIVQSAPGFVELINAKLQQEKPGLLPTTTYLLRVQSSVDVRRPNDKTLQQRDRIIINNRPYQVDVIDDIEYPGLYQVQLSEDIR